ncbi:cell wall-associated NlpC family hydrolase [Streptomyces sp. V4I8]|uniref:C40 family peptidase n=1 Tax=Streptomyces sp. V4I8 TaxID=3156469 RepID=UPI003513099F
MGPSKCGTLATAVTVICTVTLLVTPGVTFANPTPTPMPSLSPSAPLPETRDLKAVRKQLDQLYHDAAVATDAYNAAEEASKKQSARIIELAKENVKLQHKVAYLKDRAGAAVRAQYRTGAMLPEARLILSDDPQMLLDNAAILLQGERAIHGLIEEMIRAQQDLEQYAKDASAQWQKLEGQRQTKAAAAKEVARQIAAAERLEARLEKKEKERLAQLEREAELRAQTAWLNTGVLKNSKGQATEAGMRAAQFAMDQLGKPYVWGAEGPDSYDCSGLTSQAWAAAGHPIVRTSQEQWNWLKRVDIKDMRPGDLIIYFEDASHVGMYIGDGAMIHAPRPGRNVTIAGAGSMPILGVVRPGA